MIACMIAALITGRHRIELREFPEPTPHAHGAVVDIQLCGVCGTDIHAYQSGDRYNPAICGHEWTGVVSAVGAEVHDVAEGDRVVVAVPPSCGSCPPCRAGRGRYCATSFLVAVGRDPHAPAHGGFAPRLAVHASRLLPVHPALTVEQAAQVEPATVCFHAVRHTQPELGELVVVQGAGPIGLITMQHARAAGAGVVVAVEPNQARRALALELGATHAVDPERGKELITDLTHGLGADLVYECVGRPETIQGAVDQVRRGGRVCLVGFTYQQAAITPAVWLVKEVSVSASLAYTYDDFERSMALIADGRIQLDALHTGTISLDQLDATLADLASGSSHHTKVLVQP
jgi:(R,R)-butanediol dehydrogenase/meso-butanediol dehydrogenase/diacetyl reductase